MDVNNKYVKNIHRLFLQPLEPEQQRRTERDEETILGLKDGLEEFAGTTSFTVAVQQEEEEGEEESSLSFVVLQEDDTGQSSMLEIFQQIFAGCLFK
jgi:hypothetical protein